MRGCRNAPGQERQYTRRTCAFVHSSTLPETCSQNQHRVAVAVEAVPRFDRLAVRRRAPPPGRAKADDQHQQRRARQMKVRQQPRHDPKLEARVDEQVGPPAAGGDPTRRAAARPLRASASSSSQRRRSGGAPRSAVRHRDAAALADFVPLGLDPVILDLFDPNRLKCAVADVQRDFGDLDAPRRPRPTSSTGVKCSPAVGAATDPRDRANMV